MGTTSDKLTYLNTTKTQLKNGINAIGGELTDSSTFRSYVDELVKIYDYLPKVVGEGESLTLNETRKGRLSLTLKGNTSQDSTNGYQKLNQQAIRITTSGVSGAKSVDSNGYITALNTSSDGRGSTYPYTDYHLTLEAGTYTLLVECTKTTTNSSSVIYVINDSNTFLYSTATFLTTTGNHTATFTLNQTTNIGITIKLYTAEARISILSSGDTYEPYTGGIPAPNPSYSEPVNVVTGDNTIEVVGKKLFDSSFTNNTYSNISFVYDNGVITLNNTSSSTGNHAYLNSSLNNILEAGTYTLIFQYISGTMSGGALRLSIGNSNMITSTDNDNRYFSFVIPNNNTSSIVQTQTFNETKVINKWGFYINENITFSNLKFRVYIVKGTYTTSDIPTYEPYQSQTYPIYLGVENLFDINGTYGIVGFGGETISGLTLTVPKSSGNGSFMLYTQVYKGDNYALSFNTLNGTPRALLRVFDSNGQIVQDLTIPNFSLFNSVYNGYWADISNSNVNIIIPSEYNFRLGFVYTNWSLSNIQLEKGKNVNSYSEYGKEPIELCKIGDYQDYIAKSTGKNLFDGVLEIGGFDVDGLNATGVYSRLRSTNYAKVKPNTQYTIKFDNTTTKTPNVSVSYYSANDYTTPRIDFINWSSSNPLTFTTPNNCEYIRLLLKYTDDSNFTTADLFTNIMINEETTALPYEPYGTQWYIHKEIGKVVLNGSESWGKTTIFYANNVISSTAMTNTECLSNYFKYSSNASSNNSIFIAGQGTNVWINSSEFANASALQTWLSSNNVSLYYVLATPTNTIIEDTKLIEQLDNIENAMSYTEQTNIDQVNYMIRFKITAAALKELE